MALIRAKMIVRRKLNEIYPDLRVPIYDFLHNAPLCQQFGNKGLRLLYQCMHQ